MFCIPNTSICEYSLEIFLLVPPTTKSTKEDLQNSSELSSKSQPFRWSLVPPKKSTTFDLALKTGKLNVFFNSGKKILVSTGLGI